MNECHICKKPIAPEDGGLSMNINHSAAGSVPPTMRPVHHRCIATHIPELAKAPVVIECKPQDTAGKVIAVNDTPLDRADIALLRDGIMYYRSNDADENKSAVDALCDQAITALDLKDRLAAATARAEAAEKDAARYRWLRDWRPRWEVRYWTGGWWDTLTVDGLDEKIDAAQGSNP